MAAKSVQQQGGGSPQQQQGGSSGAQGVVSRSDSSGLYDVLELILDRGLVIDIFVRVSLVGIEVVTVDARVVLASVDTYLKFAEAVGRMDLEAQGQGIPDMLGSGQDQQSGGERKREPKGRLEGVKEAVSEVLGEDKKREPAGRRGGKD